MNASERTRSSRGNDVERVGAPAATAGRADDLEHDDHRDELRRSRTTTARAGRAAPATSAAAAQSRLGPTRSASRPSGTAKANDDDPGDRQAEADLGGGQADDLGEEDRAAGEERALADREEDRLERQPAREGVGGRNRSIQVGTDRILPALASVRRMISSGRRSPSRGRPHPIRSPARRRRRRVRRDRGGWRPRPSRSRSWSRPRARPAGRSGCCSRGARCSPRWPPPVAASVARARGCSRCPRHVRRGRCRSSAGRWSPGTGRCCSTTTRRWPTPSSRRAARRTSPSSRPSCTGSSSRSRTPRPSPRCSRGAASAAGRSTGRCGQRAARRGHPRRRDLRLGRDRGRLRLRRPARSTASRSRSARDGRIRIGGPTLFDGYDGDPALTPRCWSTAGS